MTPRNIEFHFDFGSPNAYLSHKIIPEIEARTGATFVYVPVLLGGVFKMTNNRSPMEAFGGIPNKLAYEQKEMARFIARHGIARFAMNPYFPLNTLLIMRGAIAADGAGVLARYVEAVFAAMWEDGRKMDDAEVAREVLDAAGLDGRALLAAAQEAGVKERLAAKTKSSVERGAFGSPTFFVGNEMFFGKDRLRDIEDVLKE